MTARERLAQTIGSLVILNHELEAAVEQAKAELDELRTKPTTPFVAKPELGPTDVPKAE